MLELNSGLLSLKQKRNFATHLFHRKLIGMVLPDRTDYSVIFADVDKLVAQNNVNQLTPKQIRDTVVNQHNLKDERVFSFKKAENKLRNYIATKLGLKK